MVNKMYTWMGQRAYSIKGELPMSNSSRIEAATRQHVGATLTNEQIVELVKIADPNWKGGVYPSDCAYTRTAEGLKPRGATAYGDGMLEYLGANSFKVLATQDIIRRPASAKKAAKPAAEAPAPAPAPVPAVAVVAAGKEKVSKKDAGKAPSQPPVAPKSRATHARA
jgi:hypothetical protein